MSAESPKEAIETQLQSQRVRFATQISRALTMAAGVTGIPMVLLLWWLSKRAYWQLPILAGSLLVLVIGAAVYPFFKRRGQDVVGAHVLLAAILFGAILTPLLVPMLMPITTLTLVIVILLAELLIGDRTGRWWIVICLAGLVATLGLEVVWPAGWSIPSSTSMLLLVGLPIQLFGLGVAAYVVRHSTQGQESSFRQAQEARAQMERLAGAEQQLREQQQTMVEEYAQFMAEIGRGNLAIRLRCDGGNGGESTPLVTLGQSLNETVANLQAMAAGIRDAANRVAAAATDIQAATAQQSRGTTEQSTALAQTSMTIDEVRAIAEQTSSRAQGVADLAQRTNTVSRAGQQAVAESIAGMQEVKSKVDTIAQNILALSEQAQAVGQIITTVNDIASQSNMLALNAAVEAARAGEMGQGFAVVAGEVRSLAEQSRAATVQVQEILYEIQRGVNTSVMATEEGMKGAEAGVHLTDQAGESLRRMTESVKESTDAAQQIAAATQQQLAGLEQIVQALQSIDRATTENVTGAHQVENAAEKLNRLSGQLRGLVEAYQL